MECCCLLRIRYRRLLSRRRRLDDVPRLPCFRDYCREGYDWGSHLRVGRARQGLRRKLRRGLRARFGLLRAVRGREMRRAGCSSEICEQCRARYRRRCSRRVRCRILRVFRASEMSRAGCGLESSRGGGAGGGLRLNRGGRCCRQRCYCCCCVEIWKGC